MNNLSEREQSRDKQAGAITYRAPQLIEFGDLATRTGAIMGGLGMLDGMGSEKTAG